MARGQGRKTQILTQTRLSAQAKAKAKAKIPMQEQTSEVILALDIGTRSIIGMAGIVEDDKVRVIAIDQEEHTERAMIDGQIENIEKVSVLAGKVKKRLEEKTRIRFTRVCVAAAGRALKTKRAEFELELPGTRLIDDEIISRLEAGAITKAEEAFDAENASKEDFRRFYLVGYTVCQYFLDQYTISNLKDHKGQHLKVDLIATFLPGEVVESLYTTMNKIGLEVASMTLEPIAAINAAIPENIRLLNLVMVDIGEGTSDIAACTGGSITGYTMATIAGDEITEAIMKKYLVDFPTAERVKAQLDGQEEITFTDILGLEHTLSKEELYKSIQGASENLSKEIADKVVEVNGTAPSALFLAGGGSKLAGLKEGIAAALGMDAGRVTVAGNYFRSSAVSDEYDLNNPEYATPLGIMVSSGLNMINDSFRVLLNGRSAKLFRSGSFTALNLLMMNGYNFRDIMGRSGQNITVAVNGERKTFYGSASEPAALFINRKEGKLSDVIHAGDEIDFIPAVHGAPAKAVLGDIEGTAASGELTLNGRHAALDTPLKNGDSIMMILPKTPDEEKAEEKEKEGEKIGGAAAVEYPEEKDDEIKEGCQEPAEVNAEEEGAFKADPETGEAAEVGSETGEAEESRVILEEEKTEPEEEKEAGEKPEEVFFRLNGNSLYLPKKTDGRPYYLMDLIQYSGIDLANPKNAVTLQVNGEEGRFQQVLKDADDILIREDL